MNALDLDPEVDLATLATPCDVAMAGEASVVKVVVSARGRALYFSRATIPWGEAESRLRHIGIYGFAREALARYPDLPASKLEATERLEQLRFLEAGIGIRVALVARAPAGIDTMESYRAFVARYLGK